MKSSDSQIPAHIKAHTTGLWAEIIFRALSSRIADRWQFISFRGTNKGEWRGVVDVLAIRKNTSQPSHPNLKRGDLFDLIIIQIKGGKARSPSAEDCIRLREVAKHYRAKHIVLFHWQKGMNSSFFILNRRTLTWKPATSAEIFG